MSGTVMSVRMERNYTLRGKFSHLSTRKHSKNLLLNNNNN